MNMIGYNIRRFRQDNNLTQEELANRLGMKKQTVSSWEAGRTEPTLGQCSSMARIFGVTVDELVSGEGDFTICLKGANDDTEEKDEAYEQDFEPLIAYMKMPRDRRKMIDEYIRFIANQK